MGNLASKKGLNQEDLAMLSKLSKKPIEEIEFWHEHFVKECPSGKLNEEKFVEYYKLFRKNENVDEIAKHCFLAFDMDNNGYVDFSEFLIAYVNTTNGVELKEKLNYVFKMYDQDQNKVIDRTEIALVIKGMFRLIGVQQENINFETCLENIMETLDVNKDSKITKEEFINGLINDPYLYAMLSPFS